MIQPPPRAGVQSCFYAVVICSLSLLLSISEYQEHAPFGFGTKPPILMPFGQPRQTAIGRVVTNTGLAQAEPPTRNKRRASAGRGLFRMPQKQPPCLSPQLPQVV